MIYDNYIMDNYGKDVEIKCYIIQDEVYLDIVVGWVDFLLVDSVVFLDGFLKKLEGKDFEFVGLDLIDLRWFGQGEGIVCCKQDKDLVEMFNKVIKQIWVDGIYKVIQDKYFDFDVYGN